MVMIRLPYLATGGMDGELTIWDIHTLQRRQTMHHDDGIVKIKWIPDSPCIASISVDCTVRIWDARSGECIRTFKGHENTVLDFDISQ